MGEKIKHDLTLSPTQDQQLFFSQKIEVVKDKTITLYSWITRQDNCSSYNLTARPNKYGILSCHWTYINSKTF